MDKVRQDVPGKGNSMVRRLRGDGASEGSCRERVLIHMADGSLDCLDTTSIKYKSAIIFEILNTYPFTQKFHFREFILQTHFHLCKGTYSTTLFNSEMFGMT